MNENVDLTYILSDNELVIDKTGILDVTIQNLYILASYHRGWLYTDVIGSIILIGMTKLNFIFV